MKRLAVILFAAGCLFGCASALPHASDEDIARSRDAFPDATVASLEAGRQAYAQRCSGCHALHLPTEKRADQWPAIVGEMQKDAHLKPGEQQLIERYLMTMASKGTSNLAALSARGDGPGSR